jgi:endonuclease III
MRSAFLLPFACQPDLAATMDIQIPALDARCHGITPARIAGLGEHELAAIIRPAGHYKAPRLTATAQKITADGPGVFTRIVTTAPASQALSYLTSFPGVAHKTAACVLVFAAQTRDTLPVDTHLFRVAHRLGLVTHDGTLTPATRDTIVSTLLSYGPDLAPAHFLFLLAGRSTCTAGTPHCPSCFLRPRCPAGGAHTGHAADSAPW